MISDTHPETVTSEYWLYQIPPHIASSFTPAQLEALQELFKAREPRQHTVDIRLSIPFLKQRFYLVLLAGEERRSTLRRHLERFSHPLWTRANLLLVSSFVGTLGLLTCVSLGAVYWNLSTASEKAAEPTAIPWLEDQQACQESGRIWQDQKCLDYQHDRLF